MAQRPRRQTPTLLLPPLRRVPPRLRRPVGTLERPPERHLAALLPHHHHHRRARHARIHNRMPVILERHHFDPCLRAGGVRESDLRTFLQPAPDRHPHPLPGQFPRRHRPQRHTRPRPTDRARRRRPSTDVARVNQQADGDPDGGNDKVACIVSSMSREGSRPIPPGGSPYSRAPRDRGFIVSQDVPKLTAGSVDPDTHNLHAGVGERCMICDKEITKGQPVRRTVSGGYVHDNC